MTTTITKLECQDGVKVKVMISDTQCFTVEEITTEQTEWKLADGIFAVFNPMTIKKAPTLYKGAVLATPLGGEFGDFKIHTIGSDIDKLNAIMNDHEGGIGVLSGFELNGYTQYIIAELENTQGNC